MTSHLAERTVTTLVVAAALALLAIAVAADAAGTTTSFHLPHADTTSTVLTSTLQVVCTSHANDSSCGLLKIDTESQAIVGDRLMLNETLNDVASARVDDSTAIVCWASDTYGRCVLVKASTLTGLAVAIPYQGFDFGGAYDLSMETRSGDDVVALLCFQPVGGTLAQCGTMSASALSNGFTTLLTLPDAMMGGGTSSVAPVQQLTWLVCYAATPPPGSEDSDSDVVTGDGGFLRPEGSVGIGKCCLLDPSAGKVPSCIFLQGTNAAGVEKTDVVVSPSSSARAVVCFTIVSAEVDEGGICTGLAIGSPLRVTSSTTFSYSDTIAALTVRGLFNVVMGTVDALMVCYESGDIACIALTFDYVSGEIATYGAEFAVDPETGMFTIAADDDDYGNYDEEDDYYTEAPESYWNDTNVTSVTRPTVTIGRSALDLASDLGSDTEYKLKGVVVLDDLLGSVVGVGNSTSSSSLTSFACVQVLMGELDTRRFCVAASSSEAFSIKAPTPARPPSTYCNVAASWMCQARSDYCSWLGGNLGCQPKSFCGVTNSEDCWNLVENYSHYCQWQIAPSFSPTVYVGGGGKRTTKKKAAKKKKKTKAAKKKSKKKAGGRRKLADAIPGVCASTLPPPTPQEYCPTYAAAKCQTDSKCRLFPNIGCRAIPFCTLSTSSDCNVSPGCAWVANEAGGGTCGVLN